MQSKSSAILRHINSNSNRALNILTAPTHERTQSNLRTLPHSFWMLNADGFKKWDESYAPIPNNHQIIDHIPYWLTFDLVWAQNKFGQAQKLGQIADRTNTPLIIQEHTWPHPSWTDKYLSQMAKLRGDLNIFITNASVEAWGWDTNDPTVRIIKHGLDTDFWTYKNYSRKNYILTVNNDWINRDWCLGYSIYQRVTVDLPTRPFGNTPGLSSAIGPGQLVEEYNTCGVFLNTTTHSPLPMALLEAAACGTPVVSTATCAIPELIKDGETGFCSNDEATIRDRLKWCLDPKNKDSVREMGEKLREFVINNYSIAEHIKSWSSIFQEAVDLL